MREHRIRSSIYPRLGLDSPWASVPDVVCRVSLPSTLVDVSVGCQRNSSGIGQASKGSSGRSALRHQTCRPAHSQRDPAARRP